MFEKIENFENAVEFLLLYLRISNWKIISLKIKQLHHLLKTIRIMHDLNTCKSSYLSGQYAGSSSIFFAYQNFSRHRKAELLHKWIALVLQVKFRFIGCLVKANALVLGNIALSLSSQLIVLVFTKQPSAERYLANIFSPVFLCTFRKF